MLGKRNIRDSIGYVTLGLFTHALLDELLEAKSKPDSVPRRQKMITLAIESLSEIESTDESSALPTADLVFQNYQEVTTLREVLSKQQELNTSSKLRSVLNAVIQSDIEKEKRAENIDKGIVFFAELARRAIIKAECPEERVPPGVRQLVS